jgi:endonuclease YncB( thermonuclease family)
MYPILVILRKKLVPDYMPLRLISILFFLILSSVPANADILGRVVNVFDGDTLEVIDSSETLYRVRLQGIDAPERGQAFSNSSRKALSELVFGRDVRVVREGLDQYQRILGHVYVSGLWVNREMIRKGMAWHYEYFNKDPRLANSEIFARNAGIGLWSDPKPEAPWIFRRENEQRSNPETTRDPDKFWLNTSSGVRHNSSCKHFMKTRRGRLCGPEEGRPCGECGG